MGEQKHGTIVFFGKFFSGANVFRPTDFVDSSFLGCWLQLLNSLFDPGKITRACGFFRGIDAKNGSQQKNCGEKRAAEKNVHDPIVICFPAKANEFFADRVRRCANRAFGIPYVTVGCGAEEEFGV
jgi:hypothetical protein